MSNTQLEVAKKRLFDADSLGASNVKLFPGTDREITPEKLSREINRALTQIEVGDYEVVDDSDG